MRPVRVSLRGTRPHVEIVIPVYNEESMLDLSVRQLHGFLADNLPFSWQVVIADNASTDRTLAIARRLARELDDVTAIHLAERGRGRALRAAWSASDALVLCYMDVDLSTDLKALLPLLAPLISGHSDVAIGTRLGRGARVSRSPRREVISRAYNGILRLALGARFSDAQCGFKAIRAEVARELLPRVRDEEWFFDTELLVLAQREGLRIHEVPVDWVEDPDSRVAIVSTATADLRGVARLLCASRIVRFAAVGLASTVAYAVLYLLLHGPLAAGAANVLALALTAVANTAANRRITFGRTGRAGALRDQAQGAFVFLATVAITSGALLVLDAVDRRPARALEVAVLIVSSSIATVVRYLGLRFWVFAPHKPPITDQPLS
ncbi:MAG: bifunctional glycosyltransferase family 2/GtrA family protein [Actinomycetota bacterium]|nr:bifunctional glycosyltransferase family 2/GtrA family protein [Actinomycetota bacterium]